MQSLALSPDLQSRSNRQADTVPTTANLDSTSAPAIWTREYPLLLKLTDELSNIAVILVEGMEDRGLL